MVADGSLLKAFGNTLQPLLIGLVFSIVVGVASACWMGLKASAEWLLAPIFIVAQAAPLAALIPVLTFAYGIGLTAKVLDGVHHGHASHRAQCAWTRCETRPRP